MVEPKPDQKPGMADNASEEVSETVKRLRETFTRLAATLRPEDEPAASLSPGPML